MGINSWLLIKMLNIAIAGSSGRMGRTLIEIISQAPDMRLSAALDRPGSTFLGKDAGELIDCAACGTPISDSLEADGWRACADRLYRPEGTLAHIAYCRAKKINLIIGTTGFTPSKSKSSATPAATSASCSRRSMSVGVNIVFKLLEQAAQVLNDGYDIEIIEAHHRHKVDAPSGTALRMVKSWRSHRAQSGRLCDLRPRGRDRRAQSIHHRLQYHTWRRYRG